MTTLRRMMLHPFLVAMLFGCGGRGDPETRSVRAGHTAAALVPGGVDARSANYRFVGGVATTGQVSSSPNFKRAGGLVGLTQ